MSHCYTRYRSEEISPVGSDDGAQILSEWDWVGSTWSGCSTEEALNFLFSRNCCLLLASLFRVLGVLCLTWLGVRAGVIFLFPLLSKEQEKDPEVRWKLKPICWLISVWMKARHCDSRDGLSFPITWGGAILVEWSRRDFRRAHAGLRVRRRVSPPPCQVALNPQAATRLDLN